MEVVEYFSLTYLGGCIGPVVGCMLGGIMLVGWAVQTLGPEPWDIDVWVGSPGWSMPLAHLACGGYSWKVDPCDERYWTYLDFHD